MAVSIERKKERVVLYPERLSLLSLYLKVIVFFYRKRKYLESDSIRIINGANPADAAYLDA